MTSHEYRPSSDLVGSPCAFCRQRPDEHDDAAQEYRKDGWPLCPQCGNDELWSPHVSAEWAKSPDWTAPLLESYFAEPFRCYYCNWEGRIERAVSS